MTHVTFRHPFEEYLQQGITAKSAIDLLSQHEALTFPQLRSKLFPAANFDDLANDETGMANAWLRDSACIGIALLGVGQVDVATETTQGVLSRLRAIKGSFEAVIANGGAADDAKRPPVRFAGQDSQPRYDWANAQNDALGYSLQLIGKVVTSGNLSLDGDEKSLIDTLVLYLETVQYWQDADSGHWEEIKKLNASSVGTVIAGLRDVRDIVTDVTKVEALIERGRETLTSLLPNESNTPELVRDADAALIFLVEPQEVVDDDMAARIITQSEEKLMGTFGFKRYVGDSYWGPDYREHFLLGDRAADFSNPDDMALRDKYLTPGDEAQWTLFDPMVATYYARKYQKTGDGSDARKAQWFITRSLMSIVAREDSEAIWRMPELFFLENGEWVPNDHLGLLWAQANLLSALTVYGQVFGKGLIRAHG